MAQVLVPRQRRREVRAAGSGRGRRLHRIGAAGVVLTLVVAWEVASLISTSEVKPGHPFVPGWEFLARHTLVGLSDYWPGGCGVEAVADGGPRTFLG